MIHEKIIVNYSLITSEVESEIEEIMALRQGEQFDYSQPRFLTERSIREIQAMSPDEKSEHSKKTAKGRLINLLQSHIDQLSSNNYTKYLKYKGSNKMDEASAKILASLFNADIPIYIDASRFLSSLLMSSDKLIKSRNEKICLAVMLERELIEKWWTAEEIITECKQYINTSMLLKEKIQECLDRRCKEVHPHLALYTVGNTSEKYALYERREKIDINGQICFQYRLRLSELIAYYNNFLTQIALQGQK